MGRDRCATGDRVDTGLLGYARVNMYISHDVCIFVGDGVEWASTLTMSERAEVKAEAASGS